MAQSLKALFPAPLTLLFDADDTLWENNIYFEQAISAFISYLDHRVHTAQEVREQLNLCERATIAVQGYGLKSFRRSLVACFERLTTNPVTPEQHERIVSFAHSIAAREVELLPGVHETLADLATRHRCILVTKAIWKSSRRSWRAPVCALTLRLSRCCPRSIKRPTGCCRTAINVNLERPG